jgi:hypothetical protein
MTKNYCIFKLKQLKIYLFGPLLENFIIENVGHSMFSDKTCCTYFKSGLVLARYKKMGKFGNKHLKQAKSS